MSGIAAVILAGGRGERLGGVIKANLLVGGIRLLDRVTLSLAGASPLIVAHGAIDAAQLALPADAVPVADLPTGYAGPLAGLAAAVDWCLALPNPPAILACAAVDTPFLPPGYLSRLASALDLAPAVVASHAGQPYPTSSAYRLDQLADLPAALRSGSAPHSLRRLIQSLGGTTLEFSAHAGGDPFANANTFADLLALNRRATAF